MAAPALNSLTYSIQGVHCSQCLKKLKALPGRTPRLKALTMDMSHQVLKVKTEEGFDSHNFVEEIRQLGFEAREIKVDETQISQLQSADRKLLAKLGVAGALAGNIMLLSFAVYLGAPEHFHKLFSALSGILFVPVLAYSASPILLNSWNAIKIKQPSIDLPLAFAILVGSALSYLNLAKGSLEIYFDSLSALVFLLLASRYIVSRFQARYITPVQIKDLFEENKFRKQTDAGTIEVTCEAIEAGDSIEVKAGQVIPVDGVLTTGQASVDNSLLTGESDPILLNQWEGVFAGTTALSDLVLEARGTQTQSRAHELFERINQALEKDSRLIEFTDRFAKYFTYGIAFLGLGFFAVYSFIDVSVAVNRVLALFVIACPCALAVTTPLVLRLALKKALKRNILVKSTSVFEQLAKAKSVVFDKTGTLTTQARQGEWLPRCPSEEQQQIIFQLEKNSRHPIAQQILRSLEISALEQLELEAVEEVPGVGVKGTFKGSVYELKASQGQQGSIGFYKDGWQLLEFVFSGAVREEVPRLVSDLKSQKLDLYLLTGDKKDKAQAVATQAGIPFENVYAEVSPEWKNDFVQELNSESPAVFIGDGLNDSLAIANSTIGVSMQQSVDSTFAASKVHLLKQGLGGVNELVQLSKRTLKTIKALLVCSFTYNAIFGVLALSGFITPLVAAILMPLSSISLLGVGVLSMQGGRS